MGILPTILLNSLQSHKRVAEPEWGQFNAIVLLGAGTTRGPSGEVTAHMLSYARAMEAVRLYRLCKKQNVSCRIYITGGDPAQNGISEAELMVGNLADLGIEEKDLVKETKSNTTFENAKFTSGLLKAENIDHTYLVTSGVHMARAMMLFSHFGINAIAAPGDRLSPMHSPIPLAPNFTFFDAAIHEYGGMLYFKLFL